MKINQISLFYLFVITFTILLSCQNQKEALPKSTGLNNEVIIIGSKKLLNSLGPEIAGVFLTPIKGLPQKEAEFKIFQIDQNEFTNIFKTHTNIILLHTSEQGNQQKTYSIEIKENVWASNQKVAVINISSLTSQTIKTNLLQQAKRVFYNKELEFIRKNIEKKSNKIVEQSIQKKYCQNILIPKEYTIIKDSANIFWAAHNPSKKEEIKHIFIFSFKLENRPFEGNFKDHQEEILQVAENILKRIKGKNNSYVKIEREYPVDFFNNECRGLWKLENKFMGGPFLIKLYPCHEKIVATIGLVFSPNTEKRGYIKKFEAIL